MATYRVEYTITITVEDGKEMSFQKEKFISEDQVSDAKAIPSYLEREFRDVEQADFILAMQSELGKNITSTTLSVSKISELLSAGDDNQM